MARENNTSNLPAKKVPADKMPPDILLRHRHWISDPRKFYGGGIPDSHCWGDYLRNVREYFVITPDLGMVLVIKQNKGEPDNFYYYWGYGRLPNNLCLFKASESLGIVITSMVAMYAPPFFGRDFDNLQPYIDQFKIDASDIRPMRGLGELADISKKADEGFKKFQQRSSNT